jgi:hypothetical protein
MNIYLKGIHLGILGSVLGASLQAQAPGLIFRNHLDETLRLEAYMSLGTLVGNRFLISREGLEGSEDVLLFDPALPVRPVLELPPRARIRVTLLEGEPSHGAFGFRVWLDSGRHGRFEEVGVFLCSMGTTDGKPWFHLDSRIDSPYLVGKTQAQDRGEERD